MKCETCNAEIQSGDEIDRFGKIICEDCYMDALSPTRMCSPWETHSAKSFIERHGAMEPTEKQKHILRILKGNGILEPEALFDQLRKQLTPAECERELAALLRMELIKIEKDQDKINIQLTRQACTSCHQECSYL